MKVVPSVKLSILMPVYYGDTKSAFEDALRSITIDQTRFPDEVIIVQDGGLGFEVNIEMYNSMGFSMVHLVLEKNVGIVSALNFGLGAVTGDIVVRMDSDDIAEPNRLELTERVFKEDSDIDLFCGAIIEINKETGNEVYRRVKGFPLSKLLIRNPFFHPAVAFKLSSVINVGCYRQVNGFEDFDLWLRLNKNNANFAKSDDVVLKFSVSKSFFLRRSGLEYLIRELTFLKMIRREGLYNMYFFSNVLIRICLRMSPKIIFKMLYIHRS